MIDWFEALILGMVQGATEYLPVSSSGHLVIFQHLFGVVEPAILFDIILHVATLVAVLWYYRRDVSDLMRQSLAALRGLMGGESWSEIQTTYPSFRLAWFILLGTVPTAFIGLVFQDTFEGLFTSVGTVGYMLWITGLILLIAHFSPQGDRRIGKMRPADALLIGFVQGLSIAPGISRSGATIAVALILGLEKETAARYSFLLSVPSIIGALILKLADADNSIGLGVAAIGFASALVTGYLCLALLVQLVKRDKLAWFAPYCFAMGLFALLLAGRL